MIDPIESILIDQLKPRLNRRNNRSMLLATEVELLAIKELEKVQERRLHQGDELDFNPQELTVKELKKAIRESKLSPLLKLKYFNEYKV